MRYPFSVNNPSVLVGILLVLAHPAVAAAPKEPWYTKTVSAFEHASYIDAKNFAVAVPALRAEFAELTLKLLGGNVHVPFGDPVFDDVTLVSPFFALFQEGARGKWVLGIKSCAGSHPCIAAPLKPVNRAEAAALIVRAFGVTTGPSTPEFTDNLKDQWYTGYLTTAASRCILQGDDAKAPGGKKRVRPGDSMNRAEMLSMLQRAMQKLTFPECAMTSAPLPAAKKELTLVVDPLSLLQTSSSSVSSSAVSASASASSSRSTTTTVLTSSAASAVTSLTSFTSSTSSPSISVPSVSSVPSITSSSSAVFDFSFPSISSASSLSANTPASTQDSGYPDLLARFQQYIAQFSDLIARARSADSPTALQLLTVLRTEIDLLNQLYQYVIFAKSRPLTASEWSAVNALETNIRSGFAGVR